MLKRNITDAFLKSLQDTPAILLNGSRQVGKSTFVKALLSHTHQYFTLDDPTILMSIKKDPSMFLNGLEGPIIIDEIQRAPELFLPLKKTIDEHRRYGYFVLTGSANVLSLPRLGDSLAGRMEIHTLWPLSRGEIEKKQEEDVISILFSNTLNISQLRKLTMDEIINWFCQGGYPEAIRRQDINRREKWFHSYMTAILEKDVRELSNIEGLMELPNLIQLLASRCGSLLNMSEVSRTLRLSNTTLKRYLSLLENLYLLVFLPAWSKNVTKRLVKAPKIYLNDTGLLSSLTAYNHERYLRDRGFLGHVLENFVVMELIKQMTWSKQPCKIYHYRTHSGQEVDILLEAPDSRVVAIEVKLAHQLSPKDFLGILDLEKDMGSNFHRGVVLYLGDTVVPFGSNKHAVPLDFIFGP